MFVCSTVIFNDSSQSGVILPTTLDAPALLCKTHSIAGAILGRHHALCPALCPSLLATPRRTAAYAADAELPIMSGARWLRRRLGKELLLDRYGHNYSTHNN